MVVMLPAHLPIHLQGSESRASSRTPLRLLQWLLTPQTLSSFLGRDLYCPLTYLSFVIHARHTMPIHSFDAPVPGGGFASSEIASPSSSSSPCVVVISNYLPSSPASWRSRDADNPRPRAARKSCGTLQAAPASHDAAQYGRWRQTDWDPLSQRRDATKASLTTPARPVTREVALSGGATSSTRYSPPPD